MITNQRYLYTYLKYMHAAFEEEASFSTIIKLCGYESYLNHPDLLNAIDAAVSYEARKKPLESANMQQLLSDLWELCHAGDQVAITERILSPTNTRTATLSYRP